MDAHPLRHFLVRENGQACILSSNPDDQEYFEKFKRSIGVPMDQRYFLRNTNTGEVLTDLSLDAAMWTMEDDPGTWVISKDESLVEVKREASNANDQPCHYDPDGGADWPAWVEATSEKPADDPVNHPRHYELHNGFECIDAILATQGHDATINFCICNAFKYLWRCRHKGAMRQDLDKALWYLRKAMSMMDQPVDEETL